MQVGIPSATERKGGRRLVQGRRLRGRAAYAYRSESSNLPGRDCCLSLAHERVITSGAGPTTRVSEGPPPGVCVRCAACGGAGRWAVGGFGDRWGRAGKRGDARRQRSSPLPTCLRSRPGEPPQDVGVPSAGKGLRRNPRRWSGSGPGRPRGRPEAGGLWRGAARRRGGGRRRSWGQERAGGDPVCARVRPLFRWRHRSTSPLPHPGSR